MFSSTTLDAGRFGEGGAMVFIDYAGRWSIKRWSICGRRLGPSAQSLVDYGEGE